MERKIKEEKKLHSLKHDLMRIGETSQFIVQIVFRQGLLRSYSIVHGFEQGTNARKVILEVYAFFVLQCTVFWRKSKHKTDVKA